MELLAEDDGFERQDARLEALFPLIMGTNSRPYRARQGRGRPRKDEHESDKPVKIDLVCPAVQGRVRCPTQTRFDDTRIRRRAGDFTELDCRSL